MREYPMAKTIDPDDPKLTAYVLGELADAERAEIEAQLETSEEGRTEVEATKAMAKRLEQALRDEPALGLTDAQRDAVLKRAKARRRATTLPKRQRREGFPFLLKAAVWAFFIGGAAFAVLNAFNFLGRDRAQQYAMTEPINAPASPAMPDASGESPAVQAVKKWQIGGNISLRYIDGPSPVQQPIELARFPDAGATAAPVAEQQTPLVLDARGKTVLSDIPMIGDIPVIGYVFRREAAEEKPETLDCFAEIARRYGESGAEATSRATRPDISNVEAYERIVDNPFLLAALQPLSTFSIDVDTASYANVRRFLTQGQMPPRDAVRIEEMVNYFAYEYPAPAGPDPFSVHYFSYDYPAPAGPDPFSVHVEVAACPWQPEHRLVRIGLKGKEIPMDDRPACNFVFLLDISGSMKDQNKLPLLRQAMKLLVQSLTKEDEVAIVTYANEARMALSSTTCDQKQVILAAIDSLHANGSTNGGAGIELAYDIATEHFAEDGVNRVILATDGDFNVGVQTRPDLVKLIEDEAKSGVFLSVLGFGTGNLKDANLEALADKGNGNYAYIDTFNEARKVLLGEMAGTLITIAKDVKVQVEFNPGVVSAYRLVGYENRVLAARDFKDDRKDAGDIGAGHPVTAA